MPCGLSGGPPLHPGVPGNLARFSRTAGPVGLSGFAAILAKGEIINLCFAQPFTDTDDEINFWCDGCLARSFAARRTIEFEWPTATVRPSLPVASKTRSLTHLFALIQIRSVSVRRSRPLGECLRCRKTGRIVFARVERHGRHARLSRLDVELVRRPDLGVGVDLERCELAPRAPRLGSRLSALGSHSRYSLRSPGGTTSRCMTRTAT